MKKYIFVYNANSGIGNALIDYGKKIVAPDKQDCELCTVTYGPFGMKKDWKDFVATLGSPIEFLHKDEYEKIHPKSSITYPAFLEQNNQNIVQLLGRSDFKKINNLNDLKESIRNLCTN